MGLNLSDYWELEEHTLGTTTFTHYGDGTAHKNRMQGNDFVQSLMYSRGVTCYNCHDVHGTGNNADLRKPVALNQMCLTCHAVGRRSGTAYGDTGAAHASRGKQRRQSVRRLPHAKNRAGNRRCECSQPYIQVHLARADGLLEDSKFVQYLSHR